MATTQVRREEASGGEVAWRKTYSDGGPRRRLAAMRWIARRLGAAPLLAPIPLTPELACRTEQAMIRRLAALGVRVPMLLEVGDRHLVLSDLGPTLAVACREEPDPARRQALVAQGFDAILAVHRAGGYLSQAFARNLTLDAQGIGFIDLEEDPGSIMPAQAAQARDLLFYAHSTARFLADVPGAHARLLAAAVAASPTGVRAGVAGVARRICWLEPVARLFGGRAREVALALESLCRATA